MIEARLRTRKSEQYIESVKGKIITDRDSQLRLTGPAFIRKPDGRPLVVYAPRVLAGTLDASYERLHRIRERTDNRGLASGTKRASAGGNRTRSRLVTSNILGAMDGIPRAPECRLTAFTKNDLDAWQDLTPLWQAIAQRFGECGLIADRYKAQADMARKTHPDWVIPGTPFTTITVNNSYPTGVHTDSGDLDAGFSCLAVLRRGDYTGGVLTFPEYGVSVDMGHGDLVMMDAHEWHGNTKMLCSCEGEHAPPGTPGMNGPCAACGAERISIVAYYRTRLAECDSLAGEDQKRERRVTEKLVGA